MANMWRRGAERRHDSPDGRSLAVVVPCAGRGFRGRVLSLVSVYGPVSGAGFDDERRVMFDSLSAILGLIPEHSVWIIGGDFNAEIGFRGVGEEATLGIHAHGRRTRSGRQMMEWAQGKELRFLLSFSRQACRDTWFHPKSFTGHAIDHLLCRSRDHRFLGVSKVLFEATVTDDREPRALGADSLTTNSGELWVLAEAFLWLRDESGDASLRFSRPFLREAK